MAKSWRKLRAIELSFTKLIRMAQRGESSIPKKRKRGRLKPDYWKNISGILAILQTIALLASVYFLHVQIKDLESSKLNRAIDFVFRIDDRLSKTPFPELQLVIESNKPILDVNGGKFTEYELDKYLDIFETLNDVDENGLISPDVLFNAYSYEIRKAYENAEIQNYLKNIREEEAGFYSGFEKLAKKMETGNLTRSH